MRIHVNDDNEFDKLLVSLRSDIINANIHYRLFRDLMDSKSEFEREMRESWTFWSLTIEAHKDSALYRLGRVFDQQKYSLSLRNFLQTTEKYSHFFEESHFRERLRENKFVDSLAKSPRKPDMQELQENINSISSNNPNVNPAVKRFVILRNRELAHRSPEVVLQSQQAQIDDPVTWEDIEELLQIAVRMLNQYSSLFKANVNSTQIVGHDDYKHVLGFVRDKIDRIEAEIADEIESYKK